MSENDIRRIVANAVPYEAGADETRIDEGAAQEAAASTIEILSGDALRPEEVRWLWRDWLALGKLHLLAGTAGTGKTTIALSFAASVTAGAPWPDGSAQAAGDVLVWSGEDGILDTLLPRFLAAGGERQRIHFVNVAREGGRDRPFDPASDMPKLVRAARGLADLKLLILDPVVSAITGDSHKNSETRRGLQPVVDFARALDCAVLGITHLAKNSGGREPLDRVAGSLAFGAVARMVLATVKPARQSTPRRLVRAKSNLGPDTGGFEYTLHVAPVPGHALHAQRIDWGQPLDGTARELMAVEKPEDAPSAVDEAETFLREALRDGPMATRELKEAAEAHGHTWRSVERAKKALGVMAIKPGYQKPWLWQLPDTKTATDDKDRHPTDLWRPLDGER